MAKEREPKRRKSMSRGTEADKEVTMAQEQRTAPMSGLSDVRAPVANAFTGIWQQIAELVAIEGKRERHEDLEVVMWCFETRSYPDFEHEKRRILVPFHTRQTSR